MGFRLGNIIILGQAEGRSVGRERQGAWRFIGRDGRTWATGTFERGVPVGTWRTFWAHGRPNKVIEVVDGLPHGRYTEHDKDGNLVLEGQHDRGHQVGPWIRRYADGTVAEEGAYAEGHRDGPWASWHDNGRPRTTAVYDRGAIVSYEEWDDAGERIA